nr:hypothetical protein [Tanacetum cinerariifolium]
SPNLDFMKPFGCPVTILKTLDHLGKFERKADDGFLVRYSVNSKAFREGRLQFKLQKVWTLVDLPNGKRAIGIKWVFRNKKDERGIVVRNKARLVAQGHTQEEGIDYDEFLLFAKSLAGATQQLNSGNHFALTVVKYSNSSNSIANSGNDLKHFIPNKYKCMLMTSSLVLQRSLYKDDGIFICQDKYVADILKKFDFTTIRIASTLIEPNKTLINDTKVEDVDVHLYRSMIGSLMYLTASRPDIMFVVCACAGFQVTPKTSHLHVVNRIFRYLKGQPKLGLWYPRDSPFDLEAFFDSDYVRASLDRKSTIGGCQFLGKRLISWQCKKQTMVANSTTEAEYVTATSCYGQVLWIQNQMLDYGFNLMNTKIYIDNEMSPTIYTSCIKHFWTSAKVKTVNDDVRLQALVDGKKVVVNEASIRCDLRLDDAEGTACLPNAAIFEELERMSAKTTAWNEFSSTMAFVIICITNNQKFNFFKYILDNMETKVPQTEPQTEEHIPIPSHDPLPSAKIKKLKKRVKKIEGKKNKRTHELKRLYKIGGRIAKIDDDEDLYLIDETLQDQRRINNQDLFGVHNLDGDEVFIDLTTGGNVDQDATVVENVEGITAATTLQISKDELTPAQTLMEIKAAKPKAKWVTIKEPKPDKPLKKKDQIALDEEVTRKLEAKMKAKMDEEERIAKEKNEANTAMIEEWDDVQAIIDADRQLVE